MSKLRITLQSLALTAFMLCLASAASAQATRTWVSGVGDDVNPCSRTAPCKTFAGAISKTATGGEISVLDPGGYGALTITKAMTVDGGTGAGWGSALASGISGFTVNITTGLATDKVILRNLSINCNNTAVDGIRFLAGKELHVQNVDIFQCASDGIEISAPATGTIEVYVKNTTVRNGGTGIRMASTGATVNVSVYDCEFANNTTGADVTAGTLNISNSNITGNSGAGLSAGGAVGSVINANDNVVTNNGGAGITAATASGTVRINGNAVQKNGIGLSNFGVMQSCSNNKVYGNTTDVSGAVSAISPGSCTQ
jgi:hypothetical protein